jgi:hypothetical protein
MKKRIGSMKRKVKEKKEINNKFLGPNDPVLYRFIIIIGSS